MGKLDPELAFELEKQYTYYLLSPYKLYDDDMKCIVMLSIHSLLILRCCVVFVCVFVSFFISFAWLLSFVLRNPH